PTRAIRAVLGRNARERAIGVEPGLPFSKTACYLNSHSGECPVLTCLRVRNFAIIDELEVELGPGMNVMTGETGAGKSILVEALKLVLGGKARPEIIRTGAEQAEVEALFDVGDEPEIKARIIEAGVEVEDELVLRRVVQRSGRSRVYLN